MILSRKHEYSVGNIRCAFAITTHEVQLWEIYAVLLLSLHMKYNCTITDFDYSFDQFDFSTQLAFFEMLFLHKKGISFGEKRTDAANQTNFTENDIGGYIRLCHMYSSTGQYNDSLALSSQIKKQEV